MDVSTKLISVFCPLTGTNILNCGTVPYLTKLIELFIPNNIIDTTANYKYYIYRIKFYQQQVDHLL